MAYANESGYTPLTVQALMNQVMTNYNTQFGTSYTEGTFIGTDAYKYFYALIQRLQENEVKTSEIFNKLQDYFREMNARISRPVGTNPGIIEKLKGLGYVASVKKPILADAGKVFLCVDVKDKHARGTVTVTSFANLVSGTDDSVTIGATVFTAQSTAVTPGDATFRAATSNTATAASLASQINAHATASTVVTAQADGAKVNLRAAASGTGGNSVVLVYTDNDSNVGATVSGATLSGGLALETGETDYDVIRPEITEAIKDSIAAGIVTQGDEFETITLTNGQAFDFRYALPNRIPVLLRLTLALSENNEVEVGNPDDVKLALIQNVAARYQLGKNFEPQRYFGVVDAPWAGSVLLEWSDDNGVTWHPEIYEAEFDELFDFGLDDISVVET